MDYINIYNKKKKYHNLLKFSLNLNYNRVNDINHG